MTEPQFKYDAFISYRHGGLDEKIARTLHKTLESFRTPRALVRQGRPAKLQRVFRDQEELSSSSDLSASIVEALGQARYLIVICSPRARQSRWIDAEIAEFRRLGRGDRILALLIEGEPAEAFPKELTRVEEIADNTLELEAPAVEPLAANIRGGTPGAIKRNLKRESLRLLAPIIGCNFDDLRQRHQAAARRQRLFYSAPVVGAGLVAAATYWQMDRLARNERLSQRVAAMNYAASLASEDPAEAAKVVLATWPDKAEDLPQNAVQGLQVLSNMLINGRVATLFDAAQGEIGALAFSPDGATVLTGSLDGELRLWSASTGTQLVPLEGLTGEIRKAVISPDGSKALTSSHDGTVRLWNLVSGKEIESYNAMHGRFSADGRQLILFEDESEQRYDVETLKEGPDEDWQQNTRNIFSPNGTRILTISTKNELRVRDLASGKTLLQRKVSETSLHNAVFSGDGENVVLIDTEGTSRILNVKTNTFTEANKDLYTDDAEALFSPNGDYVLILGGESGEDGHSAHLWDLRHPEPQEIWTREARSHEDGVREAGFTADGTQFFTRSNDGVVRIWSTYADPELESFVSPDKPYSQAALSPDGRFVLAGLESGAVRLLATKERFMRKVVGPFDSAVGRIALSEDASKLAGLFMDGTTRIFYTATATELQPFKHNERTIVSTSRNGTKPEKATETRLLPSGAIDIGPGMHNPAWLEEETIDSQFSADGRYILALTLNGDLKLWDIATRTMVMKLWSEPEPLEGIAEFHMSADGTRIATTVFDAFQIVLWDSSHTAHARSLLQLACSQIPFKAGQSDMALHAQVAGFADVVTAVKPCATYATSVLPSFPDQ